MLRDPVHQRARWLAAPVLLIFLVLFARLAWLQVINAGDTLRRDPPANLSYSAQARGQITDNGGTALALSVKVLSLEANARRITAADKGPTAEKLAPVLGMKAAELLALLSRDSGFVWLKRRLTDTEAAGVRALHLAHISIVPEYARVYPYNERAAHIIGFVSGDDNGLEGMEKWANEYLRYDPETNPVTAQVTLTINHLTQHIAEEELAYSCDTFAAKSGTVVVLDVRSGEIIALASWPTYDLNHAADYLDTANRSRLRNRAITDVFEPGSIFKIFIAAALVERGAIDMQRHYFCSGSITRAGRTVQCTHNHGDQTFADVLANSCNVGMIEAIEGIKPEELYSILRDFGFGLSSGLELGGEVGGSLYRPSQWSGQSRHSLAFGYEVAVTPMQMAAAALAIADGGLLLRPRLVRSITARDGTVLYQGGRHEVRRVVSYQTTRTLLQMMRGVVERGTGRSAAIAGFSVAGKTGTARLPNHETGGYYDNRWIGSFIGVAPADDPRLAILVAITDPTRGGYYGAQVAAPVFARVARRVLDQLGISPLSATLDLGQVAGAVRQTRYDRQPGIMPDLKGLTLAEVITLLGADFPRARLDGSGLVVEQRPAPGASRWEGELYVRLE